MKHVRRYVWVDPYLLRLLDEKGVELSAFLNKALPTFLDLPEDPTQKLLREKLEDSMIRVRLSYINEIRTRIQNAEQAQSQEDIEKAKQKELIAQLTEFGSKLQQLSCYDRCVRSLRDVDPEAPCWDRALSEFNNLNGKKYSIGELWETANEWYRKCPVPEK